jgi:adenylate kinase family enzyme
MRVAVVGTSGSGKSTFARRLAEARGIAFHELDLINWRPGWRSRSEREPEAFIADVDAATSLPEWTIAGGYSKVRALIWSRATYLVWLDLPRSLIMRQVIRRSLQRAASGEDVFPGCREDWTRLLTAEHPIRWAWDTYHRRKAQFSAMLAEPGFRHLTVIRPTSRAEVEASLRALSSL